MSAKRESSKCSEEDKEPPPDHHQPQVKKLKSSEPDLTIFLGTESKPFYYHSAILANYSDYIDTMLASPMLESKSLEIRFPDIEPEVWLKIIALLEDPTKARDITVQEAMQFSPIYDKYDFQKGCLLCSRVLTEYIEEKQPTLDLNLRVDIFVLADRLGLKQAYEACLEDFRLYNKIMLTEDHLKKLAPLIAKEKNLLDYMNSAKEDVLSPLWPRTFVLEQSLIVAEQALKQSIPKILLSGCGEDKILVRDSNDDGIFRATYMVKWGPDINNAVRFALLRRAGSDWGINGERFPGRDEDGHRDLSVIVTIPLWRAPNSANMPLPPITGWQAVDELAAVGLKLQYIYRGGEE